MREIEPTDILPVDTLSYSAINTLRKCPEKFRREYIEHDYEPRNLKLVLGGAAHVALETNFKPKVESGLDMAIPDVVDSFSDAFDEQADELPKLFGAAERNTVKAKGEAKDKGVVAVRRYMERIAPAVMPMEVERWVQMHWEGTKWTYNGKIDLITMDEATHDYKTASRAWSDAQVHSSDQATNYLAMKRALDRPHTDFGFHFLNLIKDPQVFIKTTARSEHDLDAWEATILSAAAEIRWRAENDIWHGAPDGAWWCQLSTCGYAKSCPFFSGG